MGRYAWVTLATNDAYSLGALVLAYSLRRVGTNHELACMVTPGVTETMREKLAAVFSLVQEVNVLDSKDEVKLALLARPELGVTFTKLHCWRLTQYEKCVFLDADTLVVRNCDELFEREELSAAPDVGWPDCFNSGVFVFRPSQETFASITAFAAIKGSFDGGDQGLLNMYFSDWATKDISKHLPFIYNMCSTATYSYLPAFKQFGEDVRIIHFIGITKPWLQYFDTLTGIVQPPPGSTHLQPLLQLWWNIFCDQVHPQLSSSMTGIAGALAQITLGTARSAEQTALEEHMRKQSWEQGQIDYMGRDSFDNIWKKICETLSFVPQRQPTPPKEDTTKSTESTATAEPAVETAAPMSVEVDKPVVEADKDPTQSLVSKDSPEQLLAAQTTCKIGDGSVIIAQFPEQKAPVLPSEKSVEAAATKISSEPAATGDICAKPTIEPKDVKVCETCTEVPSPKPPVESLPAETIAEQCKLASPQTTQDVAPQSESLPSKTKEPQQIVSQASTCLLTDVVCKPPAQEAITPVTQTDSTLAPTETKSGIPTSAIQDITQLAATPISVDSPQNVAASPVASEAPLKDTAKSVIEFTPAVTQPLTIDPSERHAEMLLAASEISTVSPVPIQVAESVLQAEPKESVSGAAAAVSDQAIATTVTAVQESTDVVPVAATVKSDQLNGSACESEKRGDTAIVVAAVPGLLEKTDVLPEAAKKPPSESLATKDAPSEAPSVIERKIESSSTVIPLESPSAKVEKPAEPAEQAARIEAAIVKPSEQITKMETAVAKPAEQITKTETAEAKPTEQIVKTEMVEAKPTEQIAKTETAETKPPEKIAKTETIEGKSAEQTKVEITAAKQLETTETIAKAETIEAKPAEKADIAEAAVTAESPSAVPELPIVEQSPPVEPIETKASNIPTTPTVTEATPPTSPSVESAQEEAAKKSLKKSDSADGADGEGADKKGTKKTVKKVVKKPKTKAEEATPSAEGAATAAAAATTADNSQSKTKKTVKVTKKIGAKTGQSLETDTSVPETPPPPSPSSTATSETPVPPKRKTKSTTVSTKGTTGKKSETEE